jgi:phosphomannomutase
VDYRNREAECPVWLGAAPLIELELDDSSRLFVRPSGTEPKLKLYAHVCRSITPEGDFSAGLVEARHFAARLLQQLQDVLQR